MSLTLSDTFENRRSLGSTANLPWYLPAGWCIVFSPAGARRGSWALHWEGSADPSDAYFIEQLGGLEEGMPASVTGWVTRASGATAVGAVKLQWIDATGAAISTITGNAVSAGSYARSRAVGIAPAGTVAARMLCSVSGASGSAHELFFDDLFIGGGSDADTISGLTAGQNLLNATQATGNSWTGTFGSTSNYFLSDLGIEPGEIISFGTEMKSATGADGIQMKVEFRNSGGSLISTAEPPAVNSSTYQRASKENVSIPATTDYIRVYPRNNNGTETAYWRRAMLNRGPVALPFESPPARIGRGELNFDGSNSGISDGSIAYTSGTQPRLESSGINDGATLTPAIDCKVYASWSGLAQISNTTSGGAVGEARLAVQVLIDGSVSYENHVSLEGYTTAQNLWGSLMGSKSFDVSAGLEIEVRLTVYRSFGTSGSSPAQTIYWESCKAATLKVLT